MATPLLDHETLKLDNSNYMELVVESFKRFDTITVENYPELFQQTNSTVHIENQSEEKVLFKFKSDNILACSGNFSFKQGNMDSFMYNVKPASYFKKRVCKKQYQRAVAMFTKISEIEQSNIEKLSEEMIKFRFATNILTIRGGQNMLTDSHMITISLEKSTSSTK